MSNKNLEKFARKVAAFVSAKDKEYVVDPLTILNIISVIVSILTFIYEYIQKDKEKIYSSIKSPSLMYKFLLKREIKKRWRNRKDRNTVYDSIIEVSKDLSQQELNNLFNELEDNE